MQTLPLLRRLVLAACLAATLAHPDPARAQDRLPADPLAIAWQQTRDRALTLSALAAEKNAVPAHVQSEKFLHALRSLQSQLGAQSFPPEIAQKLRAAVLTTREHALRFHVAADAKQFEAATEAAAALQETLRAIELHLPPDILSAKIDLSAFDRDAGVYHQHGYNTEPTVALRLESDTELRAGTTATLRVQLKRRSDDAVLTAADLVEAHTRRVHLLVVDPSLTDYHHLHPTESPERPGEWVCTFTPRAGGNYKVFADLLPAATGFQEFATADLAVVGDETAFAPATAESCVVEGFRFELALETDAAPTAGLAARAKISIYDPRGFPTEDLEPIMGAFAHAVGFQVERSSVLHVHPLGAEPTSPEARGGHELQFSFVPEKAGFLKFYVQVQIGGRELLAPFGFRVRPAPELCVAPLAEPAS